MYVLPVEPLGCQPAVLGDHDGLGRGRADLRKQVSRLPRVYKAPAAIDVDAPYVHGRAEFLALRERVIVVVHVRGHHELALVAAVGEALLRPLGDDVEVVPVRRVAGNAALGIRGLVAGVDFVRDRDAEDGRIGRVLLVEVVVLRGEIVRAARAIQARRAEMDREDDEDRFAVVVPERFERVVDRAVDVGVHVVDVDGVHAHGAQQGNVALPDGGVAASQRIVVDGLADLRR